MPARVKFRSEPVIGTVSLGHVSDELATKGLVAGVVAEIAADLTAIHGGSFAATGPMVLDGGDFETELTGRPVDGGSL